MRFVFIFVCAFLFYGQVRAQQSVPAPAAPPVSNPAAPSNAVDNIPRVLPSPPIPVAPPAPPQIHMPCGLPNFGPRPISIGRFAERGTYPRNALKDGVRSARVIIDITVNARGRVAAVEVISTTAPGYFEEAVINDAKTMRFQPAMTNCQMSIGHYRRFVNYRVPD